jgi:16S rRNA (adenine1518-N6/adenine1519-N6)-dimethyltransferase
MVKNTCFSPVPKVHSAVLSLKPLANMESQSVLEKTEIVTRQAFTQRRKMMSNAISNFIKPETNTSDLGFPLTARAETISPKMWVHLAKVLFPD